MKRYVVLLATVALASCSPRQADNYGDYANYQYNITCIDGVEYIISKQHNGIATHIDKDTLLPKRCVEYKRKSWSN